VAGFIWWVVDLRCVGRVLGDSPTSCATRRCRFRVNDWRMPPFRLAATGSLRRSRRPFPGIHSRFRRALSRADRPRGGSPMIWLVRSRRPASLSRRSRSASTQSGMSILSVVGDVPSNAAGAGVHPGLAISTAYRCSLVHTFLRLPRFLYLMK
jgi:hypothetical protein